MDFDASKYVVSEDSLIKDALKRIDSNDGGIVFVASSADEIVGSCTDGDIRRALLKGVQISESVSLCVNREFSWASTKDSRENIIKKLDGHVKFLPILNERKQLHLVVSRDFFPLQAENDIYLRCRAPVRVSFGGGGSDLTHYFSTEPGAVINTAISMYAHATMRVRDDYKVSIHSLDLDKSIHGDSLASVLSQKGQFGLIQEVLRLIKPKFGFDLYLNSDFPVGSGLGGSAAVTAAVLGCFNMLRNDRWDRHELSEIAFQTERIHLGIAGGWQDQYATVFGGFNFLEFHQDQNIITPMKLHADILAELEESLVLCDTGVVHDSGYIHQDQKQVMTAQDVKKRVKDNVALTYEIRNHLLRGDLLKFGESLDKTWQLKKSFSNLITNERIDQVYSGALENGAIGGKLLGAGGGGFFVFFVRPFQKHQLMKYLLSEDLKIQPFRFEPEGLKSWALRVQSRDVFKEY